MQNSNKDLDLDLKGCHLEPRRLTMTTVRFWVQASAKQQACDV
jgi:hypothetical protein